MRYHERTAQVPPNWFRLKGGMGFDPLSKKFFASSAELRRNSNAEP